MYDKIVWSFDCFFFLVMSVDNNLRLIEFTDLPEWARPHFTSNTFNESLDTRSTFDKRKPSERFTTFLLTL